MDLPAIVVDAEDVPMEAVIVQLRAIADGMEPNVMDNVRVTLAVKMTFRKLDA